MLWPLSVEVEMLRYRAQTVDLEIPRNPADALDEFSWFLIPFHGSTWRFETGNCQKRAKPIENTICQLSRNYAGAFV